MISAVCRGLLPTIRHLENRRGEGPGDEVEGSVVRRLDNAIHRINHYRADKC